MTGATLIPEFDQETANTRRVLERIPDEQLDFKPHERSFSMLELATHLANLPNWADLTLTSTELDLDRSWDRTWPKNQAELLADFDAAVATARSALERATEEDMAEGWTLRSGDQVWFTLPRAAVLRSSVMNHMIHHRAQLTVYLRLVDVPVPGMYGPSADEKM